MQVLRNGGVRQKRAIYRLKAGEQLHTDGVITPDTEMVEARVQDIFPVGGAFHEGLVNIGRSINAFCEVLAGRHFRPFASAGNTLFDRHPDRVFTRFQDLHG